MSKFDYPAKEVSLYTGAPGGGIDFATRVIAQALSARLERPVNVTNVHAESMAGVVARSAPDGSTLLMTGKILWLRQFVEDDVDYDALHDFTPISLVVRSPNLLIVNPDLPARSVQELIELAKRSPGELTFTSSGVGSSTYTAGDLFGNMAGIDIRHVDRRGNVAAVAAVVSGDVKFMFSGVTAAQDAVKAGKVRALAVGSAQRSALYPQLPTLAEAAVPGYESESILAILGPAKMPQPLLAHLNSSLIDCLRDPDVAARLLGAQLEAVGSTPEELLSTMKSEMSKLGSRIGK